MIRFLTGELIQRFMDHFQLLYGERAHECMQRLRMLIGRYGVGQEVAPRTKFWDQTDTVLITYGDMVQHDAEAPLRVLKRFLDQRLQGTIETVHILPFFPYSSDDGFSVIDYRQVDPDLGEWKEVEQMGEHFSLMFDLVLNHVSAKSSWFRDHSNGILPARHYFIEMEPEVDLSSVVRPRTSPVLTETQTRDGARHLWTTFSADQIDLNFSNPDVLFEFLDILFLYISKGMRIIRLDAIAYLWKRLGTSCIHLPETHEVVKLLRDVLEVVAPDVLLLTETNVPHEENISYFGKGDEANIVYNFSLPPLLFHALHTGNATYLSQWANTLGEPGTGCTYLNFTASHDGIGVRPLEGIIPEEEREALLQAVLDRGGHISTKTNTDGTESPYELNITYFDIFADPDEGANAAPHIARFLCSQTVPMSLKGIPAFYFHSFTATRNNVDGVKETGRARTINRRKWDESALNALLDEPTSAASIVFRALKHRLDIRRAQPAFHPDASQRVLELGTALFALERVAPNKEEVILALHNLTGQAVNVPFTQLSVLDGALAMEDLLGEATIDKKKKTITLGPWQCAWLHVAPGKDEADA